MVIFDYKFCIEKQKATGREGHRSMVNMRATLEVPVVYFSPLDNAGGACINCMDCVVVKGGFKYEK